MSDTSRVAGGVRNPGLAQVSADQVSIVGNGTNESPLHVGAGNPIFIADGRSGNAGHGKVQLGQTVVATGTPPTVGITWLCTLLSFERDSHRIFVQAV